MKNSTIQQSIKLKEVENKEVPTSTRLKGNAKEFGLY
jgi:hypothetical protein